MAGSCARMLSIPHIVVSKYMLEQCTVTDAELPLVEKCGFRVGLEFGLGFELWEWGCKEELLESFILEVPEFRFSLWVSSCCIQWMTSAS